LTDLARIHRHAGALANRRGFDGLSMNELAQALGIRTPSLYWHVAGIDSVKRALALPTPYESTAGNVQRVKYKDDPRPRRMVGNPVHFDGDGGGGGGGGFLISQMYRSLMQQYMPGSAPHSTQLRALVESLQSMVFASAV